MVISKLIKNLQQVLEKHGDLECFDCNHFPDVRLDVCSNEGLPEDWNMPEEFLMIGEEL